jgi:hypothetical protein
MNQFDDQLGQWLREVAVPEDLADSLMAIPRESRRQTVWGRHEILAAAAWAAAASLILGLSVYQWQRYERPRETILTQIAPRQQLRGPDMADASALLNELQSRQRLIDTALSYLPSGATEGPEITDGTGAWGRGLVASDRASLIVGIADQSALEWGGDPQLVASDMERLIERFPSTAGAALAERFLAHAKQQ